MSEGVETLTEATFDAAVGGSPEPYLVEFSSEWCAPCAAMRPVLEEIAVERAGKLRVGVVDILEQPDRSY